MALLNAFNSSRKEFAPKEQILTFKSWPLLKREAEIVELLLLSGIPIDFNTVYWLCLIL